MHTARGAILALVGLVLIVSRDAPSKAAAPGGSGAAPTRVAASAVDRTAWRPHEHLPLEWNGARRPIALDSMWMSDRRERFDHR